MTDEQFLEQWLPMEARLREVEDKYRIERLRVNGHPHPDGLDEVVLQDTLAEACYLYLDASPHQRSLMRDLFAWSYVLPNYLFSFMSLANEYTAQKDLAMRIRVALAATSLENNKSDFRDTFMRLRELWIAAWEARMDPNALFREAADWSSDHQDFDYNPGSMRDFFLGFRDSAFFKADVAPLLGHAR